SVPAAERRVRRKRPGLRALGAQLEENLHDFGDDIPRFLKDDRIADANISFFYEILVMERRAGYYRACDGDRAQVRDGRKHARAPDLKADVLDDRRYLFSRELERDREARRFPRISERFLRRAFLHLQHRAVDLIILAIAGAPLPLLPERHD